MQYTPGWYHLWRCPQHESWRQVQFLLQALSRSERKMYKSRKWKKKITLRSWDGLDEDCLCHFSPPLFLLSFFFSPVSIVLACRLKATDTKSREESAEQTAHAPSDRWRPTDVEDRKLYSGTEMSRFLFTRDTASLSSSFPPSRHPLHRHQLGRLAASIQASPSLIGLHAARRRGRVFNWQPTPAAGALVSRGSEKDTARFFHMAGPRVGGATVGWLTNSGEVCRVAAEGEEKSAFNFTLREREKKKKRKKKSPVKSCPASNQTLF